MSENKYTLEDLGYLMMRLRDPETGCPWDLKQTAASIVPFTLEEVYELIETIESQDHDAECDELGDVLFQIVFYAQLAQESGRYDLSDVVDRIVRKLLRRHPHVFPDGTLSSKSDECVDIPEVKARWEQIKQVERQQKNQIHPLDDIPLALPALPRAQKVQKRAVTLGLDWPSIDGVLSKVKEELAELEMAIQGDLPSREEELGDLIFSCVNLARHLNVDSEQSLREATRKFEQRARAYADLAAHEKVDLNAASDEVKDQLWGRVKSGFAGKSS